MSNATHFIDNFIKNRNEGNVDSLLSLFNTKASIEDPIGYLTTGHDSIRQFYRTAQQNIVQVKRTGATRMASQYIATPLSVRLENGIWVDSIEIITLAPSGKIEQIRSFWGMPDEEKNNVIHLYIASLNEKNTDALDTFFSPDIAIEDPVGSPARTGYAGTKQFYSLAEGINLVAELGGAICTTGKYAAFPLTVYMDNQGKRMRFEGLDLFEFNEQGKIIKGQVFWSGENMTVIS